MIKKQEIPHTVTVTPQKGKSDHPCYSMCRERANEKLFHSTDAQIHGDFVLSKANDVF